VLQVRLRVLVHVHSDRPRVKLGGARAFLRGAGISPRAPAEAMVLFDTLHYAVVEAQLARVPRGRRRESSARAQPRCGGGGVVVCEGVSLSRGALAHCSVLHAHHTRAAGRRVRIPGMQWRVSLPYTGAMMYRHAAACV